MENVITLSGVELESINADLMTDAAELALPETVQSVGSDGMTYSVSVNWDTDGYNMYKVGPQVITGALTGQLTDDGKVLVPNGAKATVTVNIIDTDAVKVACIGDSITWGDTAPADESYPAHLQRILGSGYMVANFGVSGTTARYDVPAAYTNTRQFGYSKDFQPDVVIIMLGTNDAWDVYWNNESVFAADLTQTVNTYKNLPSAPQVYVASSAFCYLEGIEADRIANTIIGIQESVALETGSGYIDINSFTAGHENWFSDKIHPTSQGYERMAYKFAYSVFDAAVKGDMDYNGIIDSVDLAEIEKILLGCSEAGADTDPDINNDGNTDIKDLISIKKILSKV